MAIKSWCLISAVIFLQISTSTWVFADDEALNSTDTGSLNDSTTSLGDVSNLGNMNQEQPAEHAGSDKPAENPFDFGKFKDFDMNQKPAADQPQQEHPDVVPTRVPKDPNNPSTFPPLVHNNGTTDKSKEATTQKPGGKSDKGGSGYFHGNIAVILSGACVLHLLY